MTDLQLLLESTVVVAFGAFVQGSVGFGVALVSVPFLVSLDPRFVPGPMIVAGTYLTILMAVRERMAIDWLGLKWAVAGRVPGILLALFVLTAVSAEQMRPLTGALVLLGVAMTASGVELRPNAANLLGAGLLSGFMGTTSSIGGPPIALVYQHQSGPELRGTLSGYFIIAGAMSLAALVAARQFSLTDLWLGLALTPGISLGFFLSQFGVKRLDRHTGATRLAVLLLAGLAGAANLVRPLVGLGGR